MNFDNKFAVCVCCLDRNHIFYLCLVAILEILTSFPLYYVQDCRYSEVFFIYALSMGHKFCLPHAEKNIFHLSDLLQYRELTIHTQFTTRNINLVFLSEKRQPTLETSMHGNYETHSFEVLEIPGTKAFRMYL